MTQQLAAAAQNDHNESNKTIDDLPDHFIISVIGCLDLKERFKCSR